MGAQAPPKHSLRLIQQCIIGSKYFTASSQLALTGSCPKRVHKRVGECITSIQMLIVGLSIGTNLHCRRVQVVGVVCRQIGFLEGK